MIARLREFILPCTLLLIAYARAQTVFIPDTYLRGWLNAAKPGSVDVNGFCDTVAWNAVPPSTVNMLMGQVPDGGTVDLEGMQYLKMDFVVFSNGDSDDIEILWPGWPRANTESWFWSVDVTQVSGPLFPLPEELNSFDCVACGLTALPEPFHGTSLGFTDVDLSGQAMVLPAGLINLNLTNCNITELPADLGSLGSLTVRENALTGFPPLPTTLVQFTAENIGVPDIPPLPAGLTHFNWRNNGTTMVPPLPAGTYSVEMQNNQIATLPPLGNVLALKLTGNPLTSLPALPTTIHFLDVDSTLITELPALPPSMDEINANGAQLLSLPALNSGLQELHVKGNVGLTCLPVLPSSLEELRLYGTSVQCLPNIPPDLNILGGQNNLGIAATLCDVSTTPCPILDPLVTGTVFNDANANGVFDGGEIVRPNAVIEGQAGNFLTGSNWNGEYVLPMDTGSFIVNGQPTLYEGTTTSPFTITFTSIGEVDSLNHIGYEVVPGIFDLVTSLEATPTRPGFSTTIWVTVHNAGTEATDGSVFYEFDSQLTYVESDYAPDAINDEAMTFTTGLLYPGASWQVAVTFYLPPTVPLGAVLLHQAVSTPDQTDTTPGDNTSVLLDPVVGSYDPNDKRVEPTVVSPLQVSMGETVTWTVRFQNTGTFPAERVLITDTLSDDLRWNTIQLLAASHAHTWHIQDGVLHVLFENINLPDSTSDEPGSHGFVKFMMKPVTNLTDGAQVFNTANIFFDFNEPVITNEAVLTVDVEAAVPEDEDDRWTIWPIPVTHALRISGPPSSPGFVEVMDVTGKTLLTSPLGTTMTELDVHTLATGTYVLRITTNDAFITRTFSKH